MRPIFQWMIRLLLGVVLLPIIFAGLMLFALAAFFAENGLPYLMRIRPEPDSGPLTIAKVA